MPFTSQIGIIDQTTAEGLTAAALGMWQAMVAGAERAGLSRIVMTAGAGGGHLSHAHGTEIDLVGYNADGSLWRPEQRVMVAAAGARAGGNRFGFYSRRGAPVSSLHVGLGYDGAPRNVAWGPNGATGGVSVNAFNAVERDFVVALRNGQMGAYLPTFFAGTGDGRPIDVRLTDAQTFGLVTNEAGPADPGANRRSMIDSVAPAIRQVVERGGLLRVGVTGEAVRQLQAFLNDAGFRDANGAELDEDAEFGRRTREALEAYQTARGEIADGKLGPDTFGRMTTDITGMDTGPAKVQPWAYTSPPPIRTVDAAVNGGETIGRRSTGDAVFELQRWLNFHGFTDAEGNALDVDGDFGPRTEQALMAAQRSAGLDPTGRLDPAGLAAFGQLDVYEAMATKPDVNATAPVDDAMPPVALAPVPVPGRAYEDVPTEDTSSALTDAQMAQYAAEKGMRTPPEFPRAATPSPVGAVDRGTLPPVITAPRAAARRTGPGEMPAEYDGTALSDAQAAQYQAERTMRTEPAPLVRSVPAPRGQAVLSWAAPIPPAPVGPLASPYRVTTLTRPLTNAERAARDGAALVAGANRAGAGVDPAAVVGGMPQITLPGATPVAAVAGPGTVQTEADRANAEMAAAEGAAGLQFGNMTYEQLQQMDWSNLPQADFVRWRRAFYDAFPSRAGAPQPVAAPAEPPAAQPAPAPLPAGAIDYGTMGREDLMRVDPTGLSREDWQRWDDAMTRAFNDLKSTGPNWLRDQLKRNGAPAERVAAAGTGDLIAMSAQANKRMVPTGTATARPKPPKNTPLDKLRLLSRPTTVVA